MTEKNVSSIIADDWYQYMNYLSGGDNVINYSWRKKRISKAERKEIKNIFQEIDDLTGLTFKKTKKKNDDIRFFSVPEINETHKAEISEAINPLPVEDLIVGGTSARSDRIKIFFRDNDKEVTTLDKYVLRHEMVMLLVLLTQMGMVQILIGILRIQSCLTMFLKVPLHVLWIY